MATLPQAPDRNLAMELVRTTEAAAMAASRWMGRGDKLGADGAAVEAMRIVLSSVQMDGIVVIGEGEKDNAPMLFNGEKIGDGTPPMTDIAVDPIDGTTPTALGRGGALAVIAVSERGTMFDPGPCVYMEKLAVGPRAKGACDIRRTPSENLHSLADALGRPVRDLTAVILDRPRHDALISEVRATGARIRLITDGDVAGAIATGWPGAGTDILFGIGGTPEGVLAAAALKCMGGEIQGRLYPRNDDERTAAIDAGYDLEAVLMTDDLVQGNNCFFAATGITDGELLRGVQYHEFGATTQSLVMRSKSGTLRKIDASHALAKLSEFSSVSFDCHRSRRATEDAERSVSESMQDESAACKSRSRRTGELAKHLLLDSVDCSSSRRQSAPTRPREFSLEDALVLRMRTSHNELESLQFL